jgi:hypothetical protein
LTFDVNSHARPGPVYFDIVLDVGNLPGEVPNSPFASSNMLTTGAQRATVQISSGTGGPSLAKRIAMHSGNPNLIDDEDILWALSKWVRNETIEGTPIRDADMVDLFSKWASAANIPTAQRVFTWLARRLGARAQGLIVQSIGLGETPSAKEKAFVVTGTGVQKTSVRVFSLSGAKVFEDSADGPRIVFRNRDRLPNGVYFYVVTVTGADGRVIQTQARKFVILH